MSCFVVPDFHIDALVSWAADHGAAVFPGGRDPRTLAAHLHAANSAAYRERYGEAVGEGYVFKRRGTGFMTPVQVIKACDCLEYQCSDWSAWRDSDTARALDRIREHAIGHLPGYQDAAWTLDEVTA